MRRIHRHVSQGNLGSTTTPCENESNASSEDQTRTTRRVHFVPSLALQMAKHTRRSILRPGFSLLGKEGAETKWGVNPNNDDIRNQEAIVRPTYSVTAEHEHRSPELLARRGPVDSCSQHTDYDAQETWIYPRNTSKTSHLPPSDPADFGKTRFSVLSKRDGRHHYEVLQPELRREALPPCDKATHIAQRQQASENLPSNSTPHSNHSAGSPLPAQSASSSYSGMSSPLPPATPSNALSPVQWLRPFKAAPSGANYLPKRRSESGRQAPTGTRSAKGRGACADSQSAWQESSIHRNDIYRRQRHRFSEAVCSEYYYVDPLSPYPPGLETTIDSSTFTSSYSWRHGTQKRSRSLACRSDKYQSDPLLMTTSGRRSEQLGGIVRRASYIEPRGAGSRSSEMQLYEAGVKPSGSTIHRDTVARRKRAMKMDSSFSRCICVYCGIHHQKPFVLFPVEASDQPESILGS
ncbi:hypothetical protein EDD37DRAFT_610251 [Exophiala viscosa]|uniref:uncharacterized protein n=1 Tax=Exophiala viscosa TaxID=2486360 RepID=UPI002190843D|nr:hypothetical protein EDD37DRAFT_610251 [Exophiala viscosa]